MLVLLYPRNILEALTILFAVWWFAFVGMHQSALSILFVSYAFWIYRSRHARGYLLFKPPEIEREITPEPEPINTSAITKLVAVYGLPNAESIKVIAGPVISREIVKLPLGSDIRKLESNMKNIKRDFGKPLVIGNYVNGHPSCIAVDVPNPNRETVDYQALYDSAVFTESDAIIPLILGKNTQDKIIVKDLSAMPHLLIAGASGSGKTSAAHTIICSLAMRFSPQYIQFQMIDLKMLDMTFYDQIPHLFSKTAYDFNNAHRVVLGIVAEMERRKTIISQARCIDVNHYNSKHPSRRLPLIIFIVDEAASIFTTEKTEDPDDEKKQKSCRAIMLLPMNIISQQSRAFGIHMLPMTQKPSKTALPSDFQANISQRICLTTRNEEDSKYIINNPNAAYLLKKGDGMYYNDDSSEYERIHMPFLDAKNGDLENVINQIKQTWG